MKAGLVLWFTGLSGAGKTTLAKSAATRLQALGWSTLLLDGDDLRPILSAGLGFGRADVIENNSRVARYCADRRSGSDITLVPIISPYIAGRAAARKIIGSGFHLIHIKSDLATVMKRDTKGLYRRASNGHISDMIGVSPDTPYEIPDDADLVIDTSASTIEESLGRLVDFVAVRLARK